MGEVNNMEKNIKKKKNILEYGYTENEYREFDVTTESFFIGSIYFRRKAYEGEEKGNGEFFFIEELGNNWNQIFNHYQEAKYSEKQYLDIKRKLEEAINLNLRKNSFLSENEQRKIIGINERMWRLELYPSCEYDIA